FTYNTAASQFTLAGSLAVSIANIGGLSVTFGHGTTPGLVITNGALTTLDMTVNANFTVGGATFQATGLEFTYNTAASQFTLAGSLSVIIANIGVLTVTFGHGTTPGLLITNGALTTLDMTVNANFTFTRALLDALPI